MVSDVIRNHRRSLRLKGYDYSQAGGYFVTICAYRKQCLFGEIIDAKMQLNEFGEVVQEEWLRTEKVRDRVELDVSMIMPNHLHGIIILKNDINEVGATRRVAHSRPCGLKAGSLAAMIGQFKSLVTKRINQMRNMRGSHVWQRNYYEHVIRNDRELNDIREYIINNPMAWDLDRENPFALSVGKRALWDF